MISCERKGACVRLMQTYLPMWADDFGTVERVWLSHPQFHCWTPLNPGAVEVVSQSLPYRFCLLDQCLLKVEETLLVNYCVLCVA